MGDSCTPDSSRHRENCKQNGKIGSFGDLCVFNTPIARTEHFSMGEQRRRPHARAAGLSRDGTCSDGPRRPRHISPSVAALLQPGSKAAYAINRVVEKESE
jgi:hypothetical protein